MPRPRRAPMADAGRVIAGRAAGRRLTAPPGEGTRPLADRVKQTLFAILEPDLVGARVLDLFAGSGAAGIEALSRGAAGAVFVERDGRAAKTIAENLRVTGLAGPEAVVVGAEVAAWLRREATAAERFDIVIVDPPYAETELLAAVLARLGEADAPLAPSGPGRGQAFLARPSAGADRAASIRAGASLRRDGAHVLPSDRRGGRMSDRRIAVYPGSFDPVTNGHLDVIGRAVAVFDQVVVAVLGNPRKAPLIDAERRVAIVRAALDAGPADVARRVDVATYDGLTVDFCRARGARSIVRGLRAISDFETEIQLAHNNRVLAPDVDSVFFMTSLEQSYVSSSLVKEIATFGGDVSGMVPAAALDALRSSLGRRG